MSSRLVRRLLIAMIIAFILISYCCIDVYATPLENTEEQYMELKVVSIQDVDGADKQIIMEWWSYGLKFKGVDLRFSYDASKIRPSDLQNNNYVTDANGEDSFSFSGDFASYMDFSTLSTENGEYRCVMDLEEYDETGTYIENDEEFGYVVDSERPRRHFIRTNELSIVCRRD